MNIAFIGNYNDREVNGVVNAGYYLAKALIKQQVKVFFYYEDHIERCFTDKDGIHHRVYKYSSSKYFLSSAFKNSIKDNRDKIQLFHLHSVFIPQHFSIACLLLRSKIPYVVTPHGGYNKVLLAKTLSRFKAIKQLYIKFIEAYVVNHAQGMIAVTQREVFDLRDFGVRCQIKVIPNTILCNELKQTSVSQVTTILFLGRYDLKAKSLYFLMQVFKVVRSINKNVKLVLCGEGKDEALLRNFIYTKHIENVEIRGPVYGEEKKTLLNECSLYFQPSQSEPFGMSIIEAMSFGKPVVITEDSYLAPLLMQYNVGLVVPYDVMKAAYSIVKYIDDRERMQAEGIRCRGFVEREFNPELVAKSTLSFYRQVGQWANISHANIEEKQCLSAPQIN